MPNRWTSGQTQHIPARTTLPELLVACGWTRLRDDEEGPWLIAPLPWLRGPLVYVQLCLVDGRWTYRDAQAQVRWATSRENEARRRLRAAGMLNEWKRPVESAPVYRRIHGLSAVKEG